MAGPTDGELREIEIRLPAFSPCGGGPPATGVEHVDARLLSRQQCRGLQALLMGLNRTHKRTEDGRHVDTAAQALRWILERIAAMADPIKEAD